MLIKLWTSNCKNLLKRMDQKVDEDNGKALNKVNVRYRKVCPFTRNEFWRNIGCLVSDPKYTYRTLSRDVSRTACCLVMCHVLHTVS